MITALNLPEVHPDVFAKRCQFFFRWRLVCWRNGENVRNGLEILKRTRFLLTGVGAREGERFNFAGWFFRSFEW